MRYTANTPMCLMTVFVFIGFTFKNDLGSRPIIVHYSSNHCSMIILFNFTTITTPLQLKKLLDITHQVWAISKGL